MDGRALACIKKARPMKMRGKGVELHGADPRRRPGAMTGRVFPARLKELQPCVFSLCCQASLLPPDSLSPRGLQPALARALAPAWPILLTMHNLARASPAMRTSPRAP